MRSLWQQRSLAVGYLLHWINSVKPRSFYSPFIHRFYQNVVAPSDGSSLFSTIEQYRDSLKKSNQPVTIPPIGAPSVVSQLPTRTVGSVARSSLSSPKFGRFLYRLVQFQQPKTIIELGTSLGVITLYLAKANPRSRVYTLEGAESVAEVARQTFERFRYQNIDLRVGNIDDGLPTLLQEIDKVDVVYLDANHRLEPTLRYFSQLLDRTHEESILIFDDIHWSWGMRKAWDTIRSHPRVTLSVDLFDAGIVFFRPQTVKQHCFLKL